jgi:hypothetical protein
MKIPATQLQPNMLPLGTYNLNVTGTNWTTIRAIGQVYKSLNNIYYLYFDIYGTKASTSVQDVTISGVTFKTGFFQSVCTYDNQNHYVQSRVEGANGTISTYFGGNATLLAVSGLCELDSKPTWLES